jgi:hypothetical protein
VAIQSDSSSSLFNLPVVPCNPVSGHNDILHLWPRSQHKELRTVVHKQVAHIPHQLGVYCVHNAGHTWGMAPHL